MVSFSSTSVFGGGSGDAALGARSGSSRKTEARDAETLSPRRASRSSGDLDGARRASLDDVVLGEIIPRLLLAHSAAGALVEREASAGGRVDAADVDRLLSAVLVNDIVAAMGVVLFLRERGASVETIYLDLFTPVARRMGDLWEDDACDFTRVTLGLCLLQRLTHRLGAPAEGAGVAGRARHILLVTPAAEQHTFGLSIVADLLRRDGWRVRRELGVEPGLCAEIARDGAFDVVGFSVACEKGVAGLADCVDAVRAAPGADRTKIVLGGPVVSLVPELGRQLGVDGVVADAVRVVDTLSSLVDLTVER